jgi:hypothetical protein
MAMLRAIQMLHSACIKVTTPCIVNYIKKYIMVSITTNETLGLYLPDVPVNVSGL